MPPTYPRITVVTPSFNQARYLGRTIRSVLDQGYPNVEYVVMDGGSTDGSIDIIQRYAGRLAYWVSEPDGGQSAAINAGWRRGSGEIVAWLNSDDYYLPGAVQTAVDFLVTHPDELMVYGQAELVDPAGASLASLGQPFSRRVMMLKADCIPQPAAFIRRSALDSVGYLDESLHFVMDLEFFIRVSQVREPRFIPAVLAGATWHAEAKTATGRAEMARERWQVRSRHARGWEIPQVRAAQLASRMLHFIPPPVRLALDRIRGLPDRPYV